jgi:signal transduction histidine kinase
VNFQATQTEEAVYIAVTDNGEGIPEEDLPHIFDRLYRVEKSRSRESGGSGLGLAIAKEIVASHGGTIQINSEQGKGTSVMIKLKRGDENA